MSNESKSRRESDASIDAAIEEYLGPGMTEDQQIAERLLPMLQVYADKYKTDDPLSRTASNSSVNSLGEHKADLPSKDTIVEQLTDLSNLIGNPDIQHVIGDKTSTQLKQDFAPAVPQNGKCPEPENIKKALEGIEKTVSQKEKQASNSLSSKIFKVIKSVVKAIGQAVAQVFGKSKQSFVEKVGGKKPSKLTEITSTAQSQLPTRSV